MSETDYAAWVGRKEHAEDVVTAAQVQGMIATLDRDDPAPKQGDPLPAMWQWMFFSTKVRRSEVGPDGHPRRGGFMPPVELPRRMFAGGRFTFHQPLCVGDAISRESEILSVSQKAGRTGKLVFVSVGHRITGPRGLAIEEENDIVYREASAPAQAPAGAQEEAIDAPWRQHVQPDPVMLFRFSALTFNGHRIHYDRPYVTGVEGYPGLIVHGPMLATLLADLARDHGRRQLAHFAFRARRAVYDTDAFDVVGGASPDGGFWGKVLDSSGAVAMESEGRFA